MGQFGIGTRRPLTVRPYTHMASNWTPPAPPSAASSPSSSTATDFHSRPQLSELYEADYAPSLVSVPESTDCPDFHLGFAPIICSVGSRIARPLRPQGRSASDEYNHPKDMI